MERREHSPSVGYVEPSAPQLAEGTRRDIDLQPRNGICVATRCQTVEQFVSTFHRWCEDSAIFIFNARWPVGTVLPFAFELANEETVLVGLGKVVEEFTTSENRFGRAGIVVAVQKLKRESVAVFKRLLAARNAAEVDRHTPAPVLARATPAPAALDQVRRQLRPTKPLEVKIPSPRERPATMQRAKTMIGIPTIAKAPPKHSVMQIPVILPRGDAKGSRAVRVPEATPRPVIQQARGTSADAVPAAIEDASHDTVRDEIPFALRNELRLLETASVARRVELDADVDVGWDVEQPLPAAPLVALPTAEAIVEPARDAIVEPARDAILEPAPDALVEPAPLEPAPLEPAPVAVLARAPAAIVEPAPEAVPVPVAADDAVQANVAREALRVPVAADEPLERIPAASDEASHHDTAAPLAIAQVALAAVSEPAKLATHDDENEVPIASSWARRSLQWAARIAIAATLFVSTAAITASIDEPSLPVAAEREAPAAASTLPIASSQTPTSRADSAQDEQVTAAPEQPAAAMQLPAPASEHKPEPALAKKPAPASEKKPAGSRAASRPARRPVSKAHCASLDCL